MDAEADCNQTNKKHLPRFKGDNVFSNTQKGFFESLIFFTHAPCSELFVLSVPIERDTCINEHCYMCYCCYSIEKMIKGHE